MTTNPTYNQLIRSITEAISHHYPSHEGRSIAMILLEHVTRQSKTELLANADQRISEEHLTQVMARMPDLESAVPIQYILGYEEFLGRRYEVDESVLIPRPETEELVMLIIDKMKGQGSPLNILDVGTGSGCIAISLALELPQAQVLAIDISSSALLLAKRNAMNLEANVAFHQWDFIQDAACPFPKTTFDVIVSNPPYIRPSEMEVMRRNVRDFEPWIALFTPEHDPDLFYRRICQFAKEGGLTTRGRLFFELNEQRADEVIDLIRGQGFPHVELFRDIHGKQRMLEAKANH